jgi:hypothetical protein
MIMCKEKHPQVIVCSVEGCTTIVSFQLRKSVQSNSPENKQQPQATAGPAHNSSSLNAGTDGCSSFIAH